MVENARIAAAMWVLAMGSIVALGGCGAVPSALAASGRLDLAASDRFDLPPTDRLPLAEGKR